MPGTWTLDRETSRTIVLVTFASQDAAKAMRAGVLANAESQAATGPALVDVRGLEVVASA